MKETIIGKCTALEKGVYEEYINCFCYIVYAFWAETHLSRTAFWIFSFLPTFVFLFVIRQIPDNDRSCFPRTYISTQLKISVYGCLF